MPVHIDIPTKSLEISFNKVIEIKIIGRIISVICILTYVIVLLFKPLPIEQIFKIMFGTYVLISLYLLTSIKMLSWNRFKDYISANKLFYISVILLFCSIITILITKQTLVSKITSYQMMGILLSIGTMWHAGTLVRALMAINSKLESS